MQPAPAENLTPQLIAPPGAPEGFRDRTRHVWIVLLLLLAAGLAGVWGAPPAYRHYKTKRALAVVAEGRRAMAAERWTDVGKAVRVVLGLAPEHPEVLRLTAEFCTRMGDPDGLNYWDMLLNAGTVTPADRRGYCRLLVLAGRWEKARPLLLEFLTQDPNDREALDLTVTGLLQQNRRQDAVLVARDLIARHPDQTTATYRLAALLLPGGDEAERREALALLWNLALRPNANRLDAIGLLTRQEETTPAEVRLLLRCLREQDTNGVTSRLLRLDLLARLPDNAITNLAASALAALPADASVPDRLQIADWLLRRQVPELALESVPEAMGRTNFALLQRHLQARGDLGRWAELETLLADMSLPFDPATRGVFQASVAAQLGRTNDVPRHLAEAMSEALTNPNLLAFVASRAEALGQPKLAAEALQRLLTSPTLVAQVTPELLRVLRQVDDEQPLIEALTRASEFFPTDDFLRNELNWMLLVTGQRLPEATANAKTLWARHTAEAHFTATWALAQVRQQRSEEALGILENLPAEKLQPSRRCRLVLAAAYGATGQRDAARRAARDLSEAGLRPREREMLRAWQEAASQ
jgi:predicted Zn-dependent protease